MDESAIKRACDAVGGQAKLARLLKVSPPAVNQWMSRGKIPAERVLDVEAATGVTRHELRPDLYPAADSQEAAA